jgi:hypothetical protein
MDFRDPSISRNGSIDLINLSFQLYDVEKKTCHFPEKDHQFCFISNFRVQHSGTRLLYEGQSLLSRMRNLFVRGQPRKDVLLLVQGNIHFPGIQGVVKYFFIINIYFLKNVNATG